MRNAAEPAQNLKARRLHIDCVEMELLRNVAANAERYTGSGYIDQDDAGVITFRIVRSHNRKYIGGGTPTGADDQ